MPSQLAYCGRGNLGCVLCCAMPVGADMHVSTLSRAVRPLLSPVASPQGVRLPNEEEEALR